MDYIIREDAFSDVMCEGVCCQECPFLINPVNGGCKIEKYIRSIPSADVIERKRGHWINHRNDNGHNIADCSLCGETLQWFDDEATPKYCCMCGAELEETDE